MEELMAEFSLLSNQSLLDKNFDPCNIQDLMKLFEVEAYKSWAAMALECEDEARSAETFMEEAEAELEYAMDMAMEEFSKCEEDLMMGFEECRSLEKEAMGEYYSLVNAGEASRRMGNTMEKAATAASNNYIEAALNSATNTMKSAWKGISSNKVHPA